MSEKNGQGSAQWSKGALTATPASKQQTQQGISTIYNANVSAALTALYGSTNHHLSDSNQHDVASYNSARFQAPPPLDSHASSSSTTSSSHTVPQPSTSNVPVPSGFVPPPFAVASSVAVTTSVLTPNPYAVSSLAAAQSLSSTTHPHQPATISSQQFLGQNIAAPQHHVHAHFAMDQFQHLNVQQQFELSKIMAAASFSSNQMATLTSTGSGQMSTSASSIAAPSLSPSTQSSTQSSTRQPNTLSFGSVGDVPSVTGGDGGTISSQLAEQVISTISTGSSGSKLAPTPIHGRLMGLGVSAPSEEKLRRIQEVVESGISDHAKQQIVQILDRISTLRPLEKLLLYLRLPGEQPETDPLRQPQNPLGTRSEINHTINWVRTHLEQDPQVSIPKQDVYNDYLIYCSRLKIKPLSTADFGKVMKQVFPGIRPRRLGTRGHSRYCYAAMRKTSKLPAPHLPTLTSIKGETDGASDVSNINISNVEDDDSWNIIKHWAENMLHVKVNDVKDLANQIKTSGNLPTATSGQTHAPYSGTPKTSNVMHKKYAQREPKEKRVMADMGPLKKRRKKKRKGSSSSESSCNQSNTTSGEQQVSLPIQPQLSPANSSKSSHQNLLSPQIYIDDGQKSVGIVNIKQEIVDSPGYTASTSGAAASASDSDVKTAPQYHSQLIASHQQQQQTMPINLASRPPPPVQASAIITSAFEQVRPQISSHTTSPNTTAVKNLTPKIMELAAESPLHSSSPPPSSQHQTATIKQEVGVDDYNTSNIFCKKVRKAQQTKGFWANSPTSSKTMASTTTTIATLPIITTTASTPPPVAASVISSPNNSSSALDSASAGITASYSMGPPAQMAPSTSPNNNQTLQEDAMGQPKVVSRNLQQLRAKKLLVAHHAPACEPPDLSAVKDAADLPENLGLPRERVISICNMDKHELDDYFLPVEEENSEDQETELLQYFQMGDAEEKLTKNSSSDAKRHSYPTVPVQSMSSTPTSTQLSVTMSSTMPATTRQMLAMMNVNAKRDGSTNNEHTNGKPIKQLSQQALNYLRSSQQTSSLKRELTTKFTSSRTDSSAVGTASASLEHIIPKHQHQQQQQQQQLQNHSIVGQPNLQHPLQPQPPTKVSYKRKINLNTSTSSDAARKNYSFLPISPNINTASSSSVSIGNNTGFFASPSFNRLLLKQQSLDSESSSDPMIGATRRRRTYVSAMTSASAPPSPSILKQQHEQQLFPLSQNVLDQWTSSTGYNNSAANHSSAVLGDQNSLDLDLFGEAAAATATATASSSSHMCGNQSLKNNCATIASVNEGNGMNNNDSIINDLTQRSRSVPLSQLQRSHSPTFNRTFQMGMGGGTSTATYSACNSLAQTPVPSEFVDSMTMLSENSCSQQSVSVKLEEVGNAGVSALLDEVDVNEILSSPEFVTKFSNISQSAGAGGMGTKTSCSSTGSSSGYSSAGQFSFSLGSYGSNGNVVGGTMSTSTSVSRSVPSTPLPHQNPQSFLGGNSNPFYKRRNNCQPLNSGSFVSNFSTSGKYGYGNMNSLLSRSACDISKSMPSTPITTTPSSFRYSPSEFTRDFLINGNSIDDSIASSFGTVGGPDNLLGSDVVGVVNGPLHSDALLNGVDDPSVMSSADGGVISPDFNVDTTDTSVLVGGTAVTGGESVVIGVGSDILDNL
uniref:RFX-type winged-helix domain-containing protein n=1 Tax=Stomoxys calcitrans TaxID=35570 RepID=A0A1I8PY04_STOCA